MKKVFSIAIAFAMIAALFAGIPTTAADPFVEYDLVDEEDGIASFASPWDSNAIVNDGFFWNAWDDGYAVDPEMFGITTEPSEVKFGNAAIAVDYAKGVTPTGSGLTRIYTNVFFTKHITTSGPHTFFFWLKQAPNANPLSAGDFDVVIEAYNSDLRDSSTWNENRQELHYRGLWWYTYDSIATANADTDIEDNSDTTGPNADNWVVAKITVNVPETINGKPVVALRCEIKANGEEANDNKYFIDGAGLVVGDKIPVNFYERTAPAVEDVVLSSGFDAGYGSVSGTGATRIVSAEFGDYSGETITLKMSEDVGASFDLTDGINTITFTQNPGTNDYVYTVAADDFAAIGSKVFTGTVQDAYTNETAISLTFNAIPTTYAVSFSVVDNAATPAAVEGATVAIDGVVIGGKATDASGNVTIRLPDGTYTYTISKAGYDDATGTITVNGADVTVANVVMKIRYTVTFTVKDVAGNPVAGAVVAVGGRTSSPTNAQGVTTLDLSTGDHTFTVTKAGYGTVTSAVTVGTVATGITVTIYADADGDGNSNLTDPDIDNDGIENRYDPDIDGDGVRNIFDKDIDGDGFSNKLDVAPLGNLA